MYVCPYDHSDYEKVKQNQLVVNLQIKFLIYNTLKIVISQNYCEGSPQSDVIPQDKK